LLFLPEGEHHELGLLFVNYLLQYRGINTIYLGTNIPLKDVDYVYNLKKPTHLYCHLTAIAQNFNFEKFLANISKKFPPASIVLSGQLTTSYTKKIPSNIAFKRSFSAVMDFIDNF
jgi:hypothetical protein